MKVLINEFDKDYPYCNEWIENVKDEKELLIRMKELRRHAGFSYTFKVIERNNEKEGWDDVYAE